MEQKYKTLRQKLDILRKRGMDIPTTTDIEDFKSLEDNNDVSCKSSLNYHITLDNKLKVKHIFPQAYSIDLVLEKICKRIKNKEEKFRKHKKFSENNLFIRWA